MEDKKIVEPGLVTEDNKKTEQPANKDIIETKDDEQRKVPTPAEVTRNNIISNAVSKVALGDKKLEDFDPWIQKLAKEQLDSFNQVEQTQDVIVEQKVQETLLAQKADNEYNNYVETLSDDDKTILDAEVKQLEAYGMPKDVALTYAKQKITPQGAPLPPAGRPLAPKTFNRVSIDGFDTMTSEQRAEYTKKSIAEFGEVAFS